MTFPRINLTSCANCGWLKRSHYILIFAKKQNAKAKHEIPKEVTDNFDFGPIDNKIKISKIEQINQNLLIWGDVVDDDSVANNFMNTVC